MHTTVMSLNSLTKICSVALRRTRCVRCIQTAVLRRAQDHDGGEESGSESNLSTKPGAGKKQASVPASDLLNVLADLKVQKRSGESGGETSLGRRKRISSAAASFQKTLTDAKQTAEGGERADEEKGQSSLGVEELQELKAEAVKKVAEVYPDQELVESDLLQELRRHDDATAAGERGETEAISSLLSGFRVQRQNAERRQDSRDSLQSGQPLHQSDQFDTAFSPIGSEVRERREAGQRLDREPYQRQRKRTLFDRQRLHLFSAAEEVDISHEETRSASIWERENQKTLKELSYATVKNGFEEAMKLTEEGKLWRYPVDNEQGLEAEQAVGFHEHVFLDHLLDDFPQRPQVLDFMELVVIGLGKNPFLTVGQKHDHVAWFRDYFWTKEAVFEKVEEQEKASA